MLLQWPTLNAFLWWTVLAAAIEVLIYDVACRRYFSVMPFRPALSSMAFLAVTGTIGALVVAPFYAWDLARGIAHPVFTLPVFVSIFYVVILRTVLATIVFNIGVDRVGAVRSAPFTHLVPIFGTIGAYLLLGEAVYWYHAAGFALVLAGIVVANRRLA